MSGGYVPNFAKKSGISFSQSKEDEFGIRALYAKMGGKNVGRLETSQNKDGIIDIGDISVDKANRGKGISSELYKEAIKRNAGKKMKGQLLPQMNRLLEKIKKGEPVSAETLFPQIKRADLAKDSVFEVYGHKGNEVEKMTRDQFSSLVNGKINELKNDPKKLQGYFGNIEADDYGGLSIDLQTQHSSGFVPNFADRKVGYLDGDVLSDPKYASIVEEQISKLNIKGGVAGYHKYLGELVNKSRGSGTLKKFTGIFGVPGAGKSSMMLGGKNSEKADNAKSRKTQRIPIITPSDIGRVDEVIDTRASSVGTAAAIDGGYWSNLDRMMVLSSSTPKEQEEIKRRRGLRDSEISKGVSKTNFGREAGTSGGAGLDSAYIEAVALDILGAEKTRVMGINSNFGLKRKKEQDLPMVERKRLGLAYGAFSPATKGHLEMMEMAKERGISPEDFIVAVSREGGKLDEKDPHSLRTLAFDQRTRRYLAEKTFRGANVVGAGSDFTGGIRRHLEVNPAGNRRRFFSAQPGSTAFVGSDKQEKDFAKYKTAGYDVSVGGRTEGISGTKAREAMLSGNSEAMSKIFPEHVLPAINQISPNIKNRTEIIPEVMRRTSARIDKDLVPIEQELAGLPSRISKNTPQDVQDKIMALRERRDKLKSQKQKLPPKILKRLSEMFPGKYGIPLSSSGFVPNFMDVRKGGLPFGTRGRMNYGSAGSKPSAQLGVGAEESTLAHELFHGAYSRSTVKNAQSNPAIGRFLSDPKKYAGVNSIFASSIFKGLNQKSLYSSLGLNDTQLDFDGKNPGATYSGSKAVDEVVTRIQEKVFKNKGNLDSLSGDEKTFVKNLEQQGLISDKRMSNVSRRSQEGSKFRNLVSSKFSSAMASSYSGFVPNFAKQKLADSPAFTNFYTDPAKPGVLEVGSIQNFEGPEQAAVVEKYLKNKIAQLGIKQIDGGSTNLPPRYLKKYSQRLGVPISGYIGGDKFGSLSKKRQAAYDPYTTSKNIFGGREFNVKSGGFVPNFAARVGIQKQRNALANSESGNIVAVHRIKPLIKDGRVSFDPSNLPTPGDGPAMVHHLEGMSGPSGHFPFANFLRLAREREMDPRYFERNNFEWYYTDTGTDPKRKRLSSGFVPNFSQALNDAIAREKSSGLSSSQIYTDTHPSLKNKNNPMGLMVANTRDEPLGGFQGVNRAKREGRNPSTYGGGMSSGFVPNFATGPIKPSQDYLNAMNAALKSVTSTINKTDTSVAEFGDEASRSAASVGGRKESFMDRHGMSMGFGLQAAAGMIGQYAGNDDTQSGRATKAAASGAGDIASFTGTGAMIAGPYGAAAGFAIGLGKAALDVTKALDSKVPDLEKGLQTSSDSMARFAESGQKLLQLNEQYSSALTSGNPTQAADIMVKTQQAYAEELSKLTQAQRDSFISAVAQGKGQEAYSKILSEMQNSVQAQATGTSLQKFSESKSWMGMGSPDTSLIKGIDKTLSSDFAGGLNAEDIGKALRDAAPALQDKSAGTENQALALMQSLAKSDALSADKKNNLQKIIDAFASAAGGTDLSAVSEAFIKSIQGKPKSFEDTKKAQEAAMAAEKIKAQKVKEEIAIREKANASLLKLQSDTESIYERFNNSIEDFISTVESAATMRENAGQFREDFNSAAGAPNAAAAEREKNIVRGSKDKLTVDIYKSQLEASNNFNSATDSLLNGLDVDIAKLGVGATGKDQQNQLLEVRSSIQQALLPIQGMIMGGDYQGAREKTKEALSGLSENQVGAVGADAIQKVGQQLDNSIKEGARKADLIYKNSQKDLAIQAQQLIFQKATAQLTKAQNFGGNNAKDIIKNSPDTEFNKAASALDDLRILGYNQESLQKNAKQPGDTSLNDTYNINDRKNNRKVTAAESGALLDFYSAASNINAGPVMSSDSKDFGVLTEALSVKIQEGLKNIQEKNKADGGRTSVVDQSVITRLQASLATLGGGDMVAKLKLMKEYGVANVGGKQVQDEALKRYSGGAFASLPPDLKKAFEATTDENAGATLLLVAGQDKQTQSLNQGFEFLSANGQTTNDILSNQPAAIADAIGAILEKGRAISDSDTKKGKANDINSKLEETKGNLETKKKEILESYRKMDEAKRILGEPGQGVSNEEFIKQQESSINKSELDAARYTVGNYAKGQELSGMDQFTTTLSGLGDAILAGSAGLGELATLGQIDFGSKSRMDSADKKFNAVDGIKSKEEYDKALALLQKSAAISDLKTSSGEVSSKSAEWQGLEKSRVQQAKDFGWAKNDEAAANAKVEQASLKAAELSQKVMPYDRSGGDAAAGYYATEKQKAASRAQALGADNLQPSALQKQARDRTSGKEKITTGDGIKTYESAANTQFGEGSNAAFEDLVSKNVLPTLEKFGKIYEQISEGGGAKGQFERMKGSMLGMTTPAPGAPTTAPGAQTEIAKGVADGVKRTQVLDKLSALGYNQKADSVPQVGTLQQAPPKSQSEQTLKNPQEQKPPQQENVNQLISSILDTVKGIANEFNKEKVSGEGSTNGSPAPQGQTGGISVNTPVTFGVNLTAGQGSDAGVAVAEQIKSGLVQFLSSAEFIQKVTSIANQAAKVKTPPKQIPVTN